MFSFRLKQVPILRSNPTPVEMTIPRDDEKMEVRELVWNFILKNADRMGAGSDDGNVAVVTRLRQEDISSLTGIPLHVVIEALGRLAMEHRLTIESQGTGRPNRYTLRRVSEAGQLQISL